jgi:hypothetical protein
MTNLGFWDYGNAHPYLALCVVITVVLGIYMFVQSIALIVSIRAKTKRILAHGWPKHPLSADGDVMLFDESDEEK